MLEAFLNHTNWTALAVATIVYFILGALWYSPALFGKPWMRMIGKTRDDLSGGSGMIFVYTFIFIAVICSAVNMIVMVTGTHEIVGAVKVGLMLGIAFAFSTNAINSMFSQKPFGLILLDSFYHVTGILVATIILGLWK